MNTWFICFLSSVDDKIRLDRLCLFLFHILYKRTDLLDENTFSPAVILDFSLPHLCSSVRSNSASVCLASLGVAERQKAAESWTSSTALWGEPSLRHTDRNSSSSPSLENKHSKKHKVTNRSMNMSVYAKLTYISYLVTSDSPDSPKPAGCPVTPECTPTKSVHRSKSRRWLQRIRLYFKWVTRASFSNPSSSPQDGYCNTRAVRSTLILASHPLFNSQPQATANSTHGRSFVCEILMLIK